MIIIMPVMMTNDDRAMAKILMLIVMMGTWSDRVRVMI